MANVTGGHELEKAAPGVPGLIAGWYEWAQAGGQDTNENPAGVTQTDVLVGYAEDAELFHTPEYKAYATFRVDDHEETWPVDGKQYERYLRHRYFREHGKAPKTQALKDAVDTIGAGATIDGPVKKVYSRLAGHEATVYVDLANESWEAIEVTRTGWRVLQDPPVKFVRKNNSAPLPHPERGGSVDELRNFLRAKDASFKLIVAWLIGTFHPEGPYPVLEINGQQGTAKSTTARLLVSLVDPSTMPLRALPRDERDLAVAASGRWVLAFDNLSFIHPRMSDAMCRLSTGGGLGTRKLYSDDDEVFFHGTRPQIVNGINQVCQRGDLQERSILVTLSPVPQEERRQERLLWAEFEAACPRIFGALLDAVASALRNRDDVELDELPRMADFAVWVTAAEEALGWEPEEFIRVYLGNRKEASEAVLDNDPVAAAIEKLLTFKGDGWSGTAGELLTTLNQHASDGIERLQSWPKAANTLSRHLNRIAPALREAGIEYGDGGREGSSSKKLKVLRRLERTDEAGEGRGSTTEAERGHDAFVPDEFDPFE